MSKKYSRSNRTPSVRRKPPIQEQSDHSVSPTPQLDNVDNLSPDQVLAMQQQFGNQFVLQMMRRKNNPDASNNTTQNSKPIQRVTGTRSIHDQEDTVDDPGMNDTIGTVGDWMGTNPNEGLNTTSGGNNGTGDSWTGMDLGTTGSVISTVTGTVGMGLGGYNLYQNIKNHKEANADLKREMQAYKPGDITGDKELYATIELLKRKKVEAQKGEWENAGNIVGGISGFINGVSGFFSTAAAGMVAGVAFGVGAGLNALLGTIAAIRDFVSARKRAKTQKQVSSLLAAYQEAYDGMAAQVDPLKGQADTAKDTLEDLKQQKIDKLSAIVDCTLKLDTLRGELDDEDLPLKTRQNKIAEVMLLKPQLEKLNKEKNDIQTEVQKAAQKVTQLAEKVSKEESRYNDYGNLITALKISERKQGYGGKLLTGGLNLVAAGGGAALLAATLGAGAVAGPVGWVLSGVALVGILSYAAGMYIKRKIRDSNVKRMTEEITMVDNYIAGTYVPGNDLLPPGYQIGGDVATREGNLWHRKMFPTQEKKGWFNKLISKSKSGTKSMKARSDELKEYLGKHSDIGTKGQVAATGFINVLRPNSPEGDQTVSNPAYDPSKPKHETKNPENVTLRKLNEGLLIYFFGDKKDEMVQSLLADDSTDEGSKKVAAAKKLLLQKLKLGD